MPQILFLAREYNKRNMVFQIHFGCIRDNNAAMYERLGADSGFDSVDNYAPADQMAALLNELSRTADIPKTILYSLNPCDNAVINSLCGCFCEAPVKNRVTQGAAWWFNDHKEGMSAQLKDYANLSARTPVPSSPTQGMITSAVFSVSSWEAGWKTENIRTMKGLSPISSGGSASIMRSATLISGSQSIDPAPSSRLALQKFSRRIPLSISCFTARILAPFAKIVSSPASAGQS